MLFLLKIVKMNLREAIKTRILELTNENLSLTSLCLNSNITPSTIFDFIYGKSKYPNILTIKKLCQGANVTLQEFFNRDYFNNEEVF